MEMEGKLALGVLVVVALIGACTAADLAADPHSMESECFLSHFLNSSCPYTELAACIQEIDFYYSFSPEEDNAIKLHLAQLDLERKACLHEGPPKTPCVHKEIARCTGGFDLLDVSQKLYICKEIPKTRTCLANISTVCKEPHLRTSGLIDLVSDRVRIAEIECRVGYYDETFCSAKTIIGCLNRFLDNGADCRSSFRGYAGNCIMAVKSRCQTAENQALIDLVMKTYFSYCTDVGIKL